MGKYKKKLRAEKAKVKIKKTKLPKGQNITDTTFKVKKIITVEQLKKISENEPVSSWNVPLKDLLIHLGHHNKSSRLNGLNGIKEVITNYPEVLKGPTLKNTVMKVLEVMGDVEAKIRAAAIAVLDTLFGKLNSNELLPFHEVLNIHLACLMTHRQVAIQKDALRLVDLLIKYAPNAIKKNFRIILVNFIRLLSGYKYGAQSEILLTRGSKGDLEENRIAIFHRLTRILNICYPDESSTNDEKKLVLNARDANLFSKRLFTSQYEKTTDLSEIFRPQGSLNAKITVADFEEDFKTLMSQILPLLFETWAEFSPPHKNNGFLEECVIKESTAKLLGLSLGIITMLCERSLNMENDDLKSYFSSHYGNQFVKLYLFGFPYLPQIMDKKAFSGGFREDESVLSFSKMYQSQNLSICYVVYKMKLKISQDLRKALDNYILQSLMMRNTKCDDVLSKILDIKLSGPTRGRAELFLEAAVKAFKHSTNEIFQDKLLHILTKVASDGRSRSNARQLINEWTPYLAKGLRKKKVTMKTLQTLSMLIRQKKGNIILEEMESNFCEILKNLPDILVEGCDPLEGKKYLVNILFWCDNKVIEDGLSSGVLDGDQYPNELRDYVVKILSFKLKRHETNL